MSRKKSFVYDLINSQNTYRPLSKVQNKIKDNKSLIERMCLNAKLPVHHGCVNTIAWSSSGKYILSGSDDLNLVITDSSTHKVKTTIHTGHRSNIFSAKYLPCTYDQHIVSCSGDGGIIFIDVQRPETSRSNIFSCHLGTAYDLVTIPNDPHVFFSCGDDSTVRLFDLREKTSCWTVGDCKEDVIINFSNPVMALAINQRYPHLLAAGSADSNAYVFDRRMLPAKSVSKGINTSDTYPIVKRFYNPLHEYGNHRITSISFSPDNDDVLVSYSCDALYMFSMKDEDLKILDLKERYKSEIVPQENKEKPVVKRVRVRGDWSDTGPHARPESEQVHTSGGSNQSYGAASRTDFILLLSHAVARLYNPRPRQSSSLVNNRANRGRPYPSTTTSITTSSTSTTTNTTNNNENDNNISSQSSRPEDLSSNHSLFSSSTPNSRSASDRTDELSTPSTSSQIPSTSVISSNRDSTIQDVDMRSSTSSTSSADNFEQSSNYAGSMHSYTVPTQARVVFPIDSIESDSRTDEPFIPLNNDSGRDSYPRRDRHHSEPSDDRSGDPDSIREDDRRRLVRSLTNVIRKYKEKRNEKWTTLSSPVYKQKYSGHRNARTMIKKATFWGNNYVMSGSDCGHIFIWDRNNGQLVMILEGDQHVVNCIQPHPFDPIFATSGIDHDIKLWYPMAAQSQWDEAKAREIMNINEVMLEEARDTVIVTSSVLFRIVTSLVSRENRD